MDESERAAVSCLFMSESMIHSVIFLQQRRSTTFLSVLVYRSCDIIAFKISLDLTCVYTRRVLLVASFLQRGHLFFFSSHSMDVDESSSSESGPESEDGKKPCQCSVCKGSNRPVSRWTRQRHALKEDRLSKVCTRLLKRRII